MGKTRFAQMQEQIKKHLEAEKGAAVSEYMEKEYKSLCGAFADRPEAFQNHMHNNIFPVVSAFRALMAQGMERSQAAELARSTFLELMEGPASALKKLMKIPGLYRTMPWMWKKAMPKLFGEEAGFGFRFYDTDSKRVKFDMTACPYYEMCRELDCLDIASTFCESDDICYGHMHPKLIWNRTKTIGRGADVCDFDLYIPKK